VSVFREVMPSAAIAFVLTLVGVWLAAESRLVAQADSIQGAWTLNKDLSDQPPSHEGGTGGDQGRGRGGYGRGGGYGGGRRGGGGGGGARGGGNSEEAARMREAMRDEMTPADHLTITQADSTIVITSQDGRTTRLSADGKKVKDESTNVERKTKWDGARLVSEINGLGRGKIVETYSVDAETHRLNITVETEKSRNRPAMTVHRVYDADAK
jgi:hypothetical protein